MVWKPIMPPPALAGRTGQGYRLLRRTVGKTAIDWYPVVALSFGRVFPANPGPRAAQKLSGKAHQESLLFALMKNLKLLTDNRAGSPGINTLILFSSFLYQELKTK